MDYLSHVQSAIEYIEANLDQDIKTEDVAREAAYSMYHFHRIFLAVVGNSVATYIRRRRLTEAAHALVEADKKVIDIALDYQFETPESFARAFKRMYGITPGQYRKQKPESNLLHQVKIDELLLRHLNGGIIMEPKIIQKDRFMVVGIKYYGENKNDEIAKMWGDFIPRIPEIEHHIHKKIGYGICYPVEEQAENGEFEYIAAVEVSDMNEIPHGMVGRTIPAQKYAVFTHKGPLNKLMETYKYACAVWPPESGYDLAKAPDFEYYDERFDPDHPEASELDIYIPIVDKPIGD